ncbi:MAG: bacteriohemerythrin [Patescibacteria group bacterium]|nr:bacteriohemerythrin [Patescibacteria group bacterium]
MKQFTWTKKYSVGVESIDEQHKHFFEIANKLIEMALNEAAEKDELVALLGSLGDYAFYHLNTEEKYFEEFHYPEAQMHVEEHNKYREKIKQLMDSLEKEDRDINTMAKDAAIYSGNWLFHHILFVDQKYTKFFQDNHVK